MSEQFYITAKKLEELKKEILLLKTAVNLLSRGKEVKDKEMQRLVNLYYHSPEDIGKLEARINELDYILRNSRLIKISPLKKSEKVVRLGATVFLEDEKGSVGPFTIVGTLEADPSSGKISHRSPLGKVLLGKKAGETVLLGGPKKIVYKIKSVRY